MFNIQSTPAAFAVTPVSSGIPVSFTLPAVNVASFIPNFYSIAVPAHTAKLEIRLLTETAAADLDLYVRFGQDVALSTGGGGVIADQTSEADITGNESVTILADSKDGLTVGTYYIAIGIFTGGKAITGTITATATIAETLVVPQFVNGGGWSTTLFLKNLSSSAEGVEVRFYNDAGLQRGVPIAGLGLSSSIRRILNPGEIVTYEALDSGALDVGWASIIPDTPVANRISGFAVFRLTAPGRPAFEAVVPLNALTDRSFTLLYDNAGGFQTGVALANPNAAPKEISVTVRDQAGQIIGLDAITLPAFAHRAFFLADVYLGLSGQKGSVSFSSDAAIAALGLRFSPTGPFTSFPYLLDANTK